MKFRLQLASDPIQPVPHGIQSAQGHAGEGINNRHAGSKPPLLKGMVVNPPNKSTGEFCRMREGSRDYLSLPARVVTVTPNILTVAEHGRSAGNVKIGSHWFSFLQFQKFKVKKEIVGGGVEPPERSL